jgi:hypothetical protein
MPKARLDRKAHRDRVRCPVCGMELARVFGMGRHFVSFGPGWVEGERGAWRLSNHSRELTKRGKKPRPRRWYRVLGPALRDFPHGQVVVRPTVMVVDFPICATCPRCGQRCEFDARELEMALL